MQPAITPERLSNLPIFCGLPPKERDDLLSEGHIQYFERGQPLFYHGDAVTHFYLVLSGTIQLYRENPEGKEKTIDILTAGRTLGEAEIMDSCAAHRVNAKAVEDSAIMEFPISWLKKTAKQHNAFALNLLSLIAERKYSAELEAEQLAQMSSPQLVACFLQRLCVLHDFDPKGFDLPYSKTLIASRLGMELETFSRTLAKLKDHGISVQGAHVIIQDLTRIEEFVCSICSISQDCPTHQAMERKIASTSGYKAGSA